MSLKRVLSSTRLTAQIDRIACHLKMTGGFTTRPHIYDYVQMDIDHSVLVETSHLFRSKALNQLLWQSINYCWRS